jgi:formamidopyrimidine-DNA glycosylase
MPELPEVETVRGGLERLIVGKKITKVEVFNPKSLQASPSDIAQFLEGSTVRTVRRRAKVLIIDLDTGYSLVSHLKMTGQMVVRGAEDWGAGHPTSSFLAELPDRSTRVEFDFTDGSRLFFNDQRKFGWVRLLPTIEVCNIDFLKKVGPEPLSGDVGLPAQFIRNIRRRNNTTIKAAILDQTVVAGIGNIYADESLWGARVHPATRVRDLTDDELRKILEAAISAMRSALAVGGSTMTNYVQANGSKGGYLDKFAKVFRREGQACPRCGATIEKIRVAGRGTHICPVCQMLK